MSRSYLKYGKEEAVPAADLHRLLRRVSHTLAIIASFAGLDAAVVGIIKGRVEAALDLHKGKQSQ